MSSTNKTSLGLNQWVGTDKPKREDFNEDNRITDEGINQLKKDVININSDLTKSIRGYVVNAADISGTTLYTKDITGRNYLNGALYNTSAGIKSGQLLGVVPIGFRPIRSQEVTHIAVTYASAGTLRNIAAINIDMSTGEITIALQTTSSIVNFVYFSLSYSTI